MMKKTLIEIKKLSDKAYSRIDNSLYKNSFREHGVVLGLDDLLKIQRLLSKIIN